MKTIKILIAMVLISTTFYACKKEEMNIKSEKVTLQNNQQNNLSSESVFDASGGMIKIIFNKVGTMIIEGNPNLEKLLNMYSASNTAISAAKTVFDATNQERLSIIFDRNGYAIASDIPNLPIGSTYESFLNNFCNVKPNESISLAITKNNIQMNNLEYWDAMSVGIIESLENVTSNIQENLPQGYSFKVEIYPNNSNTIVVLDENGNPVQQNGSVLCASNFSTEGTFQVLWCAFESISSWL
jgi:hypothetical protein